MSETGAKLVLFSTIFFLLWGLFNFYAQEDYNNPELDNYAPNYSNQSIEEYGGEIEEQSKNENFNIPSEINYVVISILGSITTIGVFLLVHPLK